MYKIGDRVYIVENARFVSEAMVKNVSGDFLTLTIGSKGTRLRSSRAFRTREEAQAKASLRLKKENPYED